MKPKNILIIHTWGIGDLVMFTPALRVLRDNFPDAVIDVLVTHQAVVADVLQENRTVDEIIKFHWKKNNIFEKLNLILRLRKKQYDWAIVTSWTNSMKGGFLALLSGAKFRAGAFKKNKSPFYTHQVPGVDKKSRRETNLDLVRAMGLKVKEAPQPFFDLNQEDVEFAEKFIKKAGAQGKILIGFHPGAEKVHDYLLWDKDYFVELGREIIKNYKDCRIIIFGGPEEQKLCREIARKIGKNVLLGIGLSLKQVMALMDNCRIFVAGDSGLGHLAAATEADLILMFGPSEAELFAPRGPKIHLFSEKCRHLYDEERVHTCLKRITPTMVVQEIEKILGKPALNIE